MAHLGISWVKLGVPNPAEVSEYYEAFGLTRTAEGALGTLAGPAQLRLEEAPYRQIIELGIAVDEDEDLEAIEMQLTSLGVAWDVDDGITVVDPSTGMRLVVVVQALERPAVSESSFVNTSVGPKRLNQRAEGLTRVGTPPILRLGHVVIGSPEPERTVELLTNGLGFKVSDRISAARMSFLRCSSDHHNVLVMKGPVPYVHHTAWEVQDIDDIARGASGLIARDPASDVWGFGRHQLGSNYFWYFKDPAGNFSEYYTDMDCITDDSQWQPVDVTKPDEIRDWPAPPKQFSRPFDLVDLVKAHES